MAYNIRLDGACKYSVVSENMIDMRNIPSSWMPDTSLSSSGSTMVFYEIKIESQTFDRNMDFTYWDPVTVMGKLRANRNNNTTSSTGDLTRNNVNDKRNGFTRKQTTTTKKHDKKLKGGVNNKKNNNNNKNKHAVISHAMRVKSYFSLESGIAVIDKKFFCLLSNQFYDGDYYVLLMTHPLEGKKTDTSISFGTDPIHEIFLHNNLLVGERSTSAAAPYWGADAILGPFTSLGRAIECSEGIVDNTRGDVSKRNKCIELHEKYDVNLYLSNIRDRQTTYSEYVHTNTPPSYIKAYQDRYVVKKMKPNHNSSLSPRQ